MMKGCAPFVHILRTYIFTRNGNCLLVSILTSTVLVSCYCSRTILSFTTSLPLFIKQAYSLKISTTHLLSDKNTKKTNLDFCWIFCASFEWSHGNISCWWTMSIWVSCEQTKLCMGNTIQNHVIHHTSSLLMTIDLTQHVYTTNSLFAVGHGEENWFEAWIFQAKSYKGLTLKGILFFVIYYGHCAESMTDFGWKL